MNLRQNNAETFQRFEFTNVSAFFSSWMLFFFDLSASLWRMFHQLFDRFGMKLCWNSTETFQRFGLTNVSAMLFLLGLVFETFFECFSIALGKFSTIFGRFWDESATVKQ